MNIHNPTDVARWIIGRIGILVIVIVLASCNFPTNKFADDGAAPPPFQGGGEEAQEGMSSQADPQGDDAPEESASTPIGEISHVPLVTYTWEGCPRPSEPEYLELTVNHSFNFSPGRQTDVYSVSATTSRNSGCFIKVVGSQVSDVLCNYNYTYEGQINTDDGPCEIRGPGIGNVEVRDGFCLDGIVTLTIAEWSGNEGLPGTMKCPQAPTVGYALAPPLTNKTLSFRVQSGSVTQSAVADPDESGYYGYIKNWTLTPAIP